MEYRRGQSWYPIMYQISVNDMQWGVTSYMNMFADDAKLIRVVKNTDDCRELQGDVNKIDEWSKRYKLDFNAKKCHVMELGKSKRKPKWNYKMGQEEILKTKEEKDLGVVIQDTVSPECHINQLFGST